VTAEFFVLAFTAAANPKLLALDLLLIENRRPRVMFLSILAGGLSIAVAIGLVDVLAVHAHAINSQQKVSAGVDLAIGLAPFSDGALDGVHASQHSCRHAAGEAADGALQPGEEVSDYVPRPRCWWPHYRHRPAAAHAASPGTHALVGCARNRRLQPPHAPRGYRVVSDPAPPASGGVHVPLSGSDGTETRVDEEHTCRRTKLTLW
jgi:hypothetical protein